MQKQNKNCLPDNFAKLMLNWYEKAKRDLPWRKTGDPYAVWVSEIMLQQTRVETVREYYVRFLAALPDAAALAGADEELLMKLWQGLGYYSRVRNMAKAAKKIMAEHNGIFPADFASIRALPGIGDYTAGAIASIAFGQPVPAVDGNVERVLARILGKTCTREELADLLKPVYPAGQCGDFTQSLMELGATVCLPNGAPLCSLCPMKDQCAAFRTDRIGELPEKKKKPERKICKMDVFLFTDEDRKTILLRKRPESGLLAGLWELPCGGEITGYNMPVHSVRKLKMQKHIFTHIEWHMTPYLAVCSRIPGGVPVAELEQAYPLPAAFSKILKSAKII